MEVHLVGHATILLKDKNFSLICDPWLEGGSLTNGTIWQYPPRIKDTKDFEPFKYMYISHDHDDHCHNETSKQIDKDTPQAFLAAAEDDATAPYQNSIQYFTHLSTNAGVKMNRIGGKILELKNIRKSYDDLLILDGFDYTFKKSERIGILGKNGVGKSTFLNIITGKEKVDSGKINIGEITEPIESSSGYLFLKLNNKKEIEEKVDLENELKQQIKFERNKQLKQFSFIYYKKLKKNTIIYETK